MMCSCRARPQLTPNSMLLPGLKSPSAPLRTPCSGHCRATSSFRRSKQPNLQVSGKEFTMGDNMKRTIGRSMRWVLVPAIAVAGIGTLIVAFLHGRQEAAMEAEQEHPPAAASRVSSEDG